MKEVLESIPVWDGIKENSECFLCSLMQKAEEDSLKYYLGPAIMVPEIRVKMNKTGFCHKHFSDLAELNKAQALALVCDTYLNEELQILDKNFDNIIKAKNAKSALKAFSSFETAVEKREEGCLVCEQMNNRLERYISTIVLLYESNPEFKKALEESKGFCIHHSLEIVKMAKKYISGDVLHSFLQIIAINLKNNLNRVQEDVYYLSQKYKSENKDKPWNGCEDAHKRAVTKLAGKSRILT